MCADAAPSMPTEVKEQKHWHKDTPPSYPACVARPVSKQDMFSKPEAVQSMKNEWNRLWEMASGILLMLEREWSEVARAAQRKGRQLHMGRLFGLCVEKGSELPDGGIRKQFKYRVVSGGDNVIDQSWEAATFQTL